MVARGGAGSAARAALCHVHIPVKVSVSVPDRFLTRVKAMSAREVKKGFGAIDWFYFTGKRRISAIRLKEYCFISQTIQNLPSELKPRILLS